MQAKEIRSLLADARGSVKTIGQLVAYAAAEIQLVAATMSGDRLAARWALVRLHQALGWPYSVGWICWATS